MKKLLMTTAAALLLMSATAKANDLYDALTAITVILYETKCGAAPAALLADAQHTLDRVGPYVKPAFGTVTNQYLSNPAQWCVLTKSQLERKLLTEKK